MTFNIYNHLYGIFYFGTKNNIEHHNQTVQKTSVVPIYPIENREVTLYIIQKPGRSIILTFLNCTE